MKKILLYPIFLLLLSVFVLANANWFNYANVGYDEANSYIGFASNIPSNHNVSSPFTCEISEAPIFSPIIADFDVDGDNEIIIFTVDKIKIYDFGCSELQTINMGENIVSMGSIVNTDEDIYPEFVVFGSSVIKWFEWNTDSDNFVMLDFMSLKGSSEFGGSCALYENNCFSVNGSRKQIIIYDLDDKTSFSKTVTTDNLQNPAFLQGYAMTRFTDSSTREFAIGEADVTAGFRTRVLSLEGNTSFVCEHVGASTWGNFRPNAIIGRLGVGTNPNNLFVSGYTSGVNRFMFSICNNNGEQKIFSGVSLDNQVSNWAIGDFNIDGSNEACIIYYNSTWSHNVLSCWDSAYTRIFQSNITIDNPYSGFIMGEFDNTNNFMEIVNNHGVWRYEIATDGFTLINNISSFVGDNNGTFIISESDTSRTNYAVYTEPSRLLVIGFLSGFSVSCGDGVCSGSENPLICPADCLINVSAPPSDLALSGEACDNNSMCVTDYCIYGYCSEKGQGMECVHNYECISNLCRNGKCTKPSAWDNIDASKDNIMGDDEETNNLVSIATMVLFGGTVMVSGGIIHAIGGILIVLLLGGFFAWVGWLSAWIFVICMIITIIGGFIVIFLKSQG